MKRSKMIEEIAKELRYYLDDDDVKKYDIETLSEMILNKVQTTGMVPPTMTFKMAGNTIVDNGWDKEDGV